MRKKDRLIEIIFQETSTFGIRINKVLRTVLKRKFKTVKTSYGQVKVKIGTHHNKVVSVSPEYGDCQKIARTKNIPVKLIYDQAKNLCRSLYDKK